MATSGHTRPHIAQPVHRSASDSSAYRYPLELNCLLMRISDRGQKATHSSHPLHRSPSTLIPAIVYHSRRQVRNEQPSHTQYLFHSLKMMSFTQLGPRCARCTQQYLRRAQIRTCSWIDPRQMRSALFDQCLLYPPLRSPSPAGRLGRSLRLNGGRLSRSSLESDTLPPASPLAGPSFGSNAFLDRLILP